MQIIQKPPGIVEPINIDDILGEPNVENKTNAQNHVINLM
jgi:hypothetical protein